MRFQVCLWVLLAIAASLRCTHLDGKLLWFDEVYTALRLSGYDDHQVTSAVYTGEPFAVQALWHFQSLNPTTNLAEGLAETVRSLAVADAQHPPLYFGLLYLWAHLFGTTTAGLRSLSALFGLACLPAAYGLGREAFGDRATAGWLMAALVAASPVQGIYAQTARQTSLWLLVLLLGTWSLLRALRLGKKRDWLWFGLATVLSLYTTPLGFWALVAQGIFTVWVRADRRSIWAFGTAAGVAILSFVPWLKVMFDHREMIQATTNWMKLPPIGGSVLWFWLANLQRLWCDVYPLLDPNHDLRRWEKAALLLMGAGIILSLGWLAWSLGRWGQQRAVILVACLAIVPWLVAALPDLVLGGRRSAQIRYFMPAAIALDLLVAGGLALAIERWPQGWRRWLQTGAIGLILVGILSFGRGLNQPTWWNQALFTNGIQASARILNAQAVQTPGPTVISQDYLGWPFSLARHLKGSIEFRLLLPKKTQTQVTADWLQALPTNTYLYRPNPELVQHLAGLGWRLVPAASWHEPFIALWELRSPDRSIVP